MTVHNNGGERRCSVGSALEGIQHLFVPFAVGGCELEDYATAGAIPHLAVVLIATCRGRPVEVPGRIKKHACHGISSVGTTGKAMQHRFLPRRLSWRKLEHYTAAIA
jgi:hypothetical protein